MQLARHFGAKVFSTGGGEQQLDWIKKLDAEPINYKTETGDEYVAKHTGADGFDVVLDSVGGANLLNSFQAVALNGHVVRTVSMCEMDLHLAQFRDLSLHVVFMLIPMLQNFRREQNDEILRNLAEIVDAGGPSPVLDDTTFSPVEASQTHARLQSRKAMGKVVIEN